MEPLPTFSNSIYFTLLSVYIHSVRANGCVVCSESGIPFSEEKFPTLLFKSHILFLSLFTTIFD